jgi:hypothetical protein
MRIPRGLLFYLSWRSNWSADQADEVPEQVYSGCI